MSVIRESAPVRVSFGSCADTDYYIDLLQWGNTVSATLSLHSYCDVHKRDDAKIVLRSLETGQVLEYDTPEEIEFADRTLNMMKAVAKHYKNTGVEVVTYTDAPLDSGLGGSAAHAIAMIKAFDKLNGIMRSSDATARLAYDIERKMLGIAGGYQDQWASAHGGANYMRFERVNGEVVPRVEPLKLRDGDLELLEKELLMVFIPRQEAGADIHGEQKKSSEKSIPILMTKRENVEKLRAALEERRFRDFAQLLHMDWKLKKQLAASIGNVRTEQIYNAAMDAGALGGRFLGAGGGGCAIFFCNGRRDKVMRALDAFGVRDIAYKFERPRQLVDFKQRIEHKMKDHGRIIEEVISSKELCDKVDAIAHKILEAYRCGGRVITFGNGGSAADAQHIAAELVNKVYLDRRMLDAIALTVNPSVITAIANDISYEKLFAHQIEDMVKKNDIVIALSTSGNSPNVIEGLRAARDKGAFTVGFSGATGGKMKDCVDILFNVPSRHVSRIQEGHLMAFHIICELIEEEFYTGDPAHIDRPFEKLA